MGTVDPLVFFFQLFLFRFEIKARWSIFQKPGAHIARSVTNTKSSKLHNIRSRKNRSLHKVEDATIANSKVLVDSPSPFSGKRQKQLRSWCCVWNVANVRRGTRFRSKEQNISSWAETKRGKVK